MLFDFVFVLFSGSDGGAATKSTIDATNCRLNAGSFGALVHGPTGHYFYGMLDAKLPGTKPMTVATKVAIDQVCQNSASFGRLAREERACKRARQGLMWGGHEWAQV